MRDTTPDLEAMVRVRYQAMRPGERVVIASGMFETARAIALASFPPGLPHAEVRRRLCERFYGRLAQDAYAPPEARSSGAV